MSDNAEKVISEVGAKVSAVLDELVGPELINEWSEAATELYKEQFELKQNPYGEAWEPKPGDDKRKSWSKFGSVTNTDSDSFSLYVAKANSKRSCVPFEPRGLGRWRNRFEEIVKRRTEKLSRAVR